MTTAHLKTIEQRLLWLSHWMIHNARSSPVEGRRAEGGRAPGIVRVDGVNDDGALLLCAAAEDRIAVKPHASPIFHAMQYLMGNQTREKMENFRGFGGVQSYPSRTKDIDDVDFSTGSVGLGVAITAFASIIQDYIAAKDFAPDRPMGRMVALVGDAEMDEGNVYECLQEGWKHGLRNCWWIIDYNRQSLDGVIREGLWERIEKIFDAFGWRVVRLRHGVIQEAAFAEPGGERLKEWIEACPNQLYSALTFQGGAAWRKRLMDEIGDQGEVTSLLDKRSDDDLSALMENLGGQCVETLADAFAQAADDDRPTCFLAYTIKGWGTPLAGHKDNHAGLMNRLRWLNSNRRWAWPRARMGPVRDRQRPNALKAFLDNVPFFAKGTRRYSDHAIEVPRLDAAADKAISTQAAFGKIMDAIAKSESEMAARVVTTAPDVTVSTNLGPWVNRRHLFARDKLDDTFQAERVPSTQKWRFRPDGQHIELGIAEMNLFLLLGAAGLSHSLFGTRLLPVGTVYDPFVARGLDALNYACYQDARFMIVGTPSGVSLAPEGGAHQSIGSPL